MSDIREIELPSGHITIIDEQDWALCSAFKLYAIKSKLSNTGYVRYLLPRPGERSQNVYLHRLITGAPSGVGVDHRNHDGFDNRKANLRLCSAAENAANRVLYANNKSGFKGVFRVKTTGRWRASITCSGQRYSLGTFANSWDAGQAYNKACLELFGDFACPNAEPGEEPATDRVATFNLSKANTSGYRGVTWDRSRCKWKAQSRGKSLGLFDDPWEAAQAVNVAARATWGESAYINVRHPDPAEQVSA
jgi:hypothetical protein